MKNGVQPSGLYYSCKDNPALNTIQQDHIDGNLNVYSPVEAYTEEWEHKADRYGNFISALAIPGTRKRRDLPSIAQQWREDAQKRKK